ncbi:PilW family protein [Acinetobacter radioresistens]|jgi:type IV pilus assembly protein PilW|uniref:PilW family protein n=1 Tax=Acinetobacter radioresistens TaxID=40216 RepID=UPI0001BBB0FF|nr:PilW family protein [Acinetobacter radioresistens]EEY85777.1 prepilin-type cleavage/methylation N-terminal domain protein [Acinetobacter radioresistens SH164]MCK4094575.1 prepilin-type N-terminal cleavage/methylation domain-containing protein [Acinetobacter radioresistens]MDY0840585.1 PilW family protein [Acinetobacter radioresistens]
MKISYQSGFTLIELMIAITLGLILVAVAIQLLISGQVNYRIQTSASSLQDSGVFGVSYVTKNIRLANHGNAGVMNDESLYGGIVLSNQTSGSATPLADGNLKDLKVGTAVLTGTNLISANQNNDSAFNSYDKSDQLVIIYQAPMNTFTCDGKKIKGPEKTNISYAKGWYVIERYYIKKDAIKNEANLNCSSAMFIATDETVPQTYESTTISAVNTLTTNYASNAGEMIARNVEYMRVQLIVRYGDGSTRTLGINDYNAIPISATVKHRPAIIGINLGWLVRSSEKVSMSNKKSFLILDKTITVPNDRYMRHIYTTTIALRNGGLGDVIQ